MGKLRKIVFMACLLSGIAGGCALSERLLPNSDSELGVDMCPECGHLSPWIPKVPHDDVHDEDLARDIRPNGPPSPNPLLMASSGSSLEDLGADMCPECGPLPPWMPKVRHSDVYEKDLGVETCRGCRQSLATPVPETSPCSTLDEDLGADMCPECGCLSPWMAKVPSYDVHEKDLGVDMCPECSASPFPAPKASTCSTVDEDLGVGMCPEKGQHLSVAERPPMQSVATDSNSLLRELQKLVRVQQSQIDRLAEVLYQVSKCRPEEAGLKGTSLPGKAESPAAIDFTAGKQRPLEGKVLDQNDYGTGLARGDDAGRAAGVTTIARYRPAWAGHFSFLSAVKVEREVSCLHVLPQIESDGLSRYMAVGDQTGRLYIFSWLGDLLLDYPTISMAPITAMVSYALHKNISILSTGHADGAVLVHRVLENVEKGSSSKDHSTTFASLDLLHSLVPPSPHSLRSGDGDTAREWDASDSEEEGNASVANLEIYKVGKMRYTVVADMGGKIQIFRNNGSLHGVVQSPGRPLAFMRIPNAQRLVFLTDRGIGSLDLRSMQVHKSLCEGLNASTVTAYAFDVTGRSKAYGFTDGGDVLSVALTGNMVRLECHVRNRRSIEIPGPFSPLALRGYLLAATSDAVLVFNTTVPAGRYADFWKSGPTPLFSVNLDEISMPFLSAPIKSKYGQVMASNREKLVVLGFGGGYVGIFRSNLPTAKSAHFGAKFWNSSLIIFLLVLVVLWQFFVKKRDQGVVMGPEYPRIPSPSGVSSYGKEEIERTEFSLKEKAVESRRLRAPSRQNMGTMSFDRGGFRPVKSSPADADKYFARREPLFSSTRPVRESESQQ